MWLYPILGLLGGSLAFVAYVMYARSTKNLPRGLSSFTPSSLPYKQPAGLTRDAYKLRKLPEVIDYICIGYPDPMMPHIRLMRVLAIQGAESARCTAPPCLRDWVRKWWSLSSITSLAVNMRRATSNDVRLAGCTHAFEDQGYEFDTGLHYVGRIEKYKPLLDLVSQEDKVTYRPRVEHVHCSIVPT